MEPETYSREELLIALLQARKEIRILEVQNARMSGEFSALSDSYNRLSSLPVIRWMRGIYQLLGRLRGRKT